MKWLISPLAVLITGGVAAYINPGNAFIAVGVSSVGAIAGASVARSKKHDDLLVDALKRMNDLGEKLAHLEHPLPEARPSAAEFEQRLEQTIQPLARQLSQCLESIITSGQTLQAETLSEQYCQQLEKITITASEKLSTQLRSLANALLDDADSKEDLRHQMQEQFAALGHHLETLQHQLLKKDRQPPQTAVLYDIENFIFTKGHKISPQIIEQKVSFDAILSQIRENFDIGDVLVQRAYGNWMNQLCNILKSQPHKAAIDFVQVYGSNHAQKNAADIHLALDAIDLLHQYPTINTYVIISGDGGFGSLALKLRDYGKTVIGCAYNGSASASLQKVCHHFLLIDSPFEDIPPTTAAPSNKNTSIKQNNEIKKNNVIKQTNEIKPLSKFNQPLSQSISILKTQNPVDHQTLPGEELAKVGEILHRYAADPAYKSALLKGIEINLVQEAIYFFIPNLDILRYQTTKFAEFLQYASTAGTSKLCVGVSKQGNAWLCQANHMPKGLTIKKFTPMPIHGLHTYRRIFPGILAGGMFLELIAQWLTRYSPQNMPINQAIRQILREPKPANQPYGENVVRKTINNYITANVLIKSSSNTITLKPEMRTPEQILGCLQKNARQVLTQRLAGIGETLNESLFQQLFIDAAVSRKS